MRAVFKIDSSGRVALITTKKRYLSREYCEELLGEEISTDLEARGSLAFLSAQNSSAGLLVKLDSALPRTFSKKEALKVMDNLLTIKE